MKKLFLLLVFFCSGIQAQNETTDLPNYTLPSPQAYEMTKYGNVPINESTGKVTASVPLYTYTAGKLSLPISLNYMGNGVKVDQNNTWTGVNWTLNAGGLITRTIHHKVDEKASERIFQAEIDLLITQYESELANAEAMNSYFNSPTGQWDTQPDIFNFSFVGHSGSFYLNKDFIPTLINVDSNLKIEILGPETETDKYNLYNTKEFKITDTQGIEYYFGGDFATEDTEMEHGWHEEFSPLGTTSFYLTQIKHPLSGTIFFEYNNGSAFKVATSQNRTIVKYQPKPGLGYNGACGFAPDTEEPMQESTGQYNSTIVYTNVTGARSISRIYSPYDNTNEVIFNTSVENGGYNFSTVLNQIEINSGMTSKKIDFEYLFDGDAENIISRFFLEKVIFDKDVDDHKEYEFKYKTPLELPERFSTAQDALGYYNGKESNTNMLFDVRNIPAGGLGSASNVLSSCTSCRADRSSDLDFKTMGTLTKMYYPTGGYTLFEYEAEETKRRSTERIFMHAWSYDSSRIPQNNVPVTSNIGGFYMDADGTPNSTSVFETQQVTATMNISLGGTQNLDFRDYISFEVTDLETGFTNELRFNFPEEAVTDPNFSLTEFVKTKEFTLVKDHEYDFKLSFKDIHDNSFTSTTVNATVVFDYANGYQLYEGEGLRVKRVSDFTNDFIGAPKYVKRYYYKKLNHLFDTTLSSVPVYREPSFYEQHQLLKKTWLTTDCGSPMSNYRERNYNTCSVETHNGYSLSIFPSNYSEFQLTNYENVVISYGGDEFENGGVSKTFTLGGGGGVIDYHIGNVGSLNYKNMMKTHKNASWLNLYNGKLKKEVYLKRGSGDDQLYKIKENSYLYTNQVTYIEPIITGTVVIDCGPGYAFPFSRVGLGKYDIFSRRIHIENQINIDYLDPVPLSTNILNPTIDESAYRKIISTTDYEYNSYAGQPTKVTTTTSESNIKKVSTTSYVDTAGSFPLLSLEQLTAYTALENEHRIASPIQTESFEIVDDVSTLLGKQRTLYKTYPNGFTQANIMQAAKSTDDLENRVIYNKYDVRGNPVELYKKNGTPVVYIWSALSNKPAAKIVNATYDQVQAALSDLRTNLPNAQVTEYTYTGLLSLLSSVTDARGYKTTYHYDDLDRLKYVKDDDGNILSKNEYNYKN